jgi:hypothetical protein
MHNFKRVESTANHSIPKNSATEAKVTVSVRIPYSSKKKLEAIAEKEHRSPNSKLTAIVVDYLEGVANAKA